MRYGTILFDADGTLLDFNRAEREGLEKAFARNGMRFDGRVDALYQKINHQLWRDFELGNVTRREITETRFARLFERLGIRKDGVRFNEEYLDALGEGGWVLPDAPEGCRELSGMGCRMYIVTNGVSRTQYSRMEKSGLNPYFEGMFVSEDTGCQKPMKGYFDYVAAHIPDFRPARALVAGDSLTSDIAGGRNAGLDTCWLNPLGESSDLPTYQIRSLAELPALVAGV